LDQQVKIKIFVLYVESESFTILPSCRVGPICTNAFVGDQKPYPVIFARWLITQYGSSFSVTLRSEEGINVKIHLPERYSDVVDYSDIVDINTG